ncbi:hypothetical protein NC653_016345 [Populus alba x Populus x berolinensis]|uniref:Uncharacterized protein n=1 Tax=Populus alba x Populus x berolinensis TaxID=444605 RepID=A0AAD6QMM2_9ROSI|nr:hypothetical protein NC653_016345 [Populus alba x Populus x berolinensis]
MNPIRFSVRFYKHRIKSRLKRASMATRGLIDLMSGFMYAYQNSARRSMGFSLMKDVFRQADIFSLSWAPLMFRPPWIVIFGKLSKRNVTIAGDAMPPHDS